MFAKIVALFALFAVALAAPKAAPPTPQYLAYTGGVDLSYPLASAGYVSPYAAPLAYSSYPTYPAAGAYLVR